MTHSPAARLFGIPPASLARLCLYTAVVFRCHSSFGLAVLGGWLGVSLAVAAAAWWLGIRIPVDIVLLHVPFPHKSHVN